MILKAGLAGVLCSGINGVLCRGTLAYFCRNIYIIAHELPGQPFSGPIFNIETVDPTRTFLEKAFLLHEEFSKASDKVRSDRMSRHLYDLDRLMDTEHGHSALSNPDLYRSIIEHREKFNLVKGVNYNNHHPSLINFIPP